MRVLLLAVSVVLLAAPLLAAPQKGAVRPLRRVVPANPAHSPAEWDAILASQSLGREVCVDCSPGTKPQDPLAGKVAAPKPDHGLRVINGDYAADNQFPWMADITMDNTWSCGGSLISDTFILTAAQCASGYNVFQVILGDTSTLFSSEGMHIAATYKAFAHDDYSEDDMENDIGLLQLLVPISFFTKAISPVKLPSSADVSNTFEGKTATISGWGTTEDGYSAYFLRYVEQSVMSNERCARFLGHYVRANIICGDGEGDVGACGSDTGAPFVVKGDNDEWKQIGIFSFGSDQGCNWGSPSAYTRVTEHLQWIQTKTGILP